MNALIQPLLAAVMAAGCMSPGLAQTTSGVPPAIWTQIEALGPVVDPAGAGKIYAQRRARMPQRSCR
jgi:hypothetical protein